MKSLKYFFWFIDLGFVLYWVVVFFKLLPPEYLFANYHNPIVINWNWSFLALDFIISLSGFYSLYLFRKDNPKWKFVALISLILTSISGLQALAFWLISGYFDLLWWLPNLFLFFYPFYFIYQMYQNYES